MRKLLSLCILFLTFCLVGCFDTQEDVTINADGSGVFKTSMDMSGMWEMLQMAALMDTSAKKDDLKTLSEKDVDSTVALRAFADTASNLSAEEKALYRDATMHIKVDQSEKVFKITMNFPFKKMDDLQKISELQTGNKSINPLKKMTSGGGGMDEESEEMPAPDFLSTVFKNGLIERKVDQKKLEEKTEKGDMKEAKQMGAMLSQITFSTSIRLPKPATTATGNNVKLSDDKKTILIKYTLQDMLESPKDLEFKIQY